MSIIHMTTYYGSIIYDGTDVTGAMVSVASNGPLIYGAFLNQQKIVHVDATGNVNSAFITPTFEDIRGMVVAHGYLFVTNYTSDQICAYLLTSVALPPVTIDVETHPVGICTDWDGISTGFNIYMTNETNNNVSCYYFDTSFSLVSTFSTDIAEFLGSSRTQISYKAFNSYKYLYIATMQSGIIQVDITNISTPVSTVIYQSSTMTQSYGLVCHPTENILFVSDFLNTGVLAQYAYNANVTTGSMTAFTDVTVLIYGYTNTAVSNGGVSTGQSVIPLGICMNVTNGLVNIYVATDDSYIVKLYPDGGSPAGGGPACFNKGTNIMCLIDQLEQYIPVEQLRRGMLVKTYKGSYRRIKKIGKRDMVNDPTHFRSCMFLMPKQDHMTGDLVVTGGHAILVDELTELQLQKYQELGIKYRETLDDKKLLLVAASELFVKQMNTDLYTYYHFILENEGDRFARYGVYANGVLSETPSEYHFNNFMQLSHL